MATLQKNNLYTNDKTSAPEPITVNNILEKDSMTPNEDTLKKKKTKLMNLNLKHKTENATPIY